MDFDGIVTYLLVEQHALEELSFKLEEERLILLAGRHRLLDRATAEVAFAAAALTAIGETRATLLRQAATDLGLPVDASLRTIAEAAPSAAIRARLRSLREGMRATLGTIGATTAHNRELLARGLAATTDALTLLGTSISYDASGATRRGGNTPALIDTRV